MIKIVSNWGINSEYHFDNSRIVGPRVFMRFGFWITIPLSCEGKTGERAECAGGSVVTGVVQPPNGIKIRGPIILEFSTLISLFILRFDTSLIHINDTFAPTFESQRDFPTILKLDDSHT